MKVFFAAITVFFFLLTPLSYANLLVGGDSVYTVRKGDTIDLVSARLGVSQKQIVRENKLDPKKPLKKGMTLRVNTRKIVPVVIDEGIVINIPDRMLYYLRDGEVASMFPVALGMPPKKDSADWTTPLGKFTVLRKEKNPSWYVPKSIQEEMEEEGKPVETIVPPGPENPLGRYAIKTSIPGILIHETIKPRSIFNYRSHGCIRVMPEHMEKFFPLVELDTPGELIYQPVKVALSDQGGIYMEVTRDPYKRIRDLRLEAMSAIEDLGLSEFVDWNKIERAVKEKNGIPMDITLTQMTYQARRESRGQRRAN